MKEFVRKAKMNQRTMLSDMSFYAPAPSEPWPIFALAISIVVAAAFRGVDYIFLPQRDAVLVAVETAAPIRVWGIGFLIGCSHCIIGRLAKKYSVCIIGHSILASLYFSLGVGYIEEGSHDISADYLRNGVALILVFSATHLVYAYAMWRRWDAQRRSRM